MEISEASYRLVEEASGQTWTGGGERQGQTEHVATLVGRRGAFRLYRRSRSHGFDVLTPRQRAVAEAAARGDTLPQIAEELGVGFETVKSHLKAVYERLDIASRTELVQVKHGQLRPPGLRRA